MQFTGTKWLEVINIHSATWAKWQLEIGTMGRPQLYANEQWCDATTTNENAAEVDRKAFLLSSIYTLLECFTLEEFYFVTL